MLSLHNHVVIVTGAGRGIGLGIARILAERGAKVVIAEADTSAGQQAVDSLTADNFDCIFVKTDVGIPNSVATMVERVVATYGRIDSLVNNVGITQRQPFTDLTPERWANVLNVNLTSVYHCVRACLPHLQTSTSAAIVNITSVNAYRTIQGMGAYPATKAGIIGLTRSLAVDLAPKIRVNAVAPGVILTDTWAYQVGDVQAAIDNRLRYIPRNRAGTPEDVGRAVAFLISTDADYITGSVLHVDGGMLSQLYAEGDA